MKPTIEHAKILFANKYAEPSVVEHNAQAWLTAVQVIGDKWLLAKKVERKAK